MNEQYTAQDLGVAVGAVDGSYTAQPAKSRKADEAGVLCEFSLRAKKNYPNFTPKIVEFDHQVWPTSIS